LRTLQRFATVCFVGAAFAALISACSSTDPATTGGGAGAVGAAGAAHAGAGPAAAGAPAAQAGAGTAAAGSPPALTGDATKGQAAYADAKIACNGCHGEMGEGMSGANISGSATAGIGMWTENQFYNAVRSAKNKAGLPLCMLMVPFAASVVSDQQIADIYAWLLTQKGHDTKVAGSYCGSAVCTCTGGS
jgi:cytochrome c553